MHLVFVVVYSAHLPCEYHFSIYESLTHVPSLPPQPRLFTLPVADYILTPSHAVERKAIPDLIQSLQSGRLATQLAEMCKYVLDARLHLYLWGNHVCVYLN